MDMVDFSQKLVQCIMKYQLEDLLLIMFCCTRVSHLSIDHKQ